MSCFIFKVTAESADDKLANQLVRQQAQQACPASPTFFLYTTGFLALSLSKLQILKDYHWRTTLSAAF